MSLTWYERNALADVQAGLARSDPRFAASFDGLIPRAMAWWWLGGSMAALLLTGVAVERFGMAALGALAMLLVLGSPLAVALGARAAEGPPEEIPPRQPVRETGRKEPPGP